MREQSPQGEKLNHMVSDQYSAVYFTSVKTLAHHGLEHTHIGPASKDVSMRFVEHFLLPLQIKHLTLLTCREIGVVSRMSVFLCMHLSHRKDKRTK